MKAEGSIPVFLKSVLCFTSFFLSSTLSCPKRTQGEQGDDVGKGRGSTEKAQKEKIESPEASVSRAL